MWLSWPLLSLMFTHGWWLTDSSSCGIWDRRRGESVRFSVWSRARNLTLQSQSAYLQRINWKFLFLQDIYSGEKSCYWKSHYGISAGVRLHGESGQRFALCWVGLTVKPTRVHCVKSDVVHVRHRALLGVYTVTAI